MTRAETTANSNLYIRGSALVQTTKMHNHNMHRIPLKSRSLKLGGSHKNGVEL